jgi:MSHA pilin protein MshA
MLKTQKGFTLIELVIVIVILGILAAVAIPKYIGLQSDARVAAVKGLYGTVRSSSAMVHAAYLAKDTNPATIAVEGGGNITIANGYPAEAIGGIDTAVQFDITDFTYDAVSVPKMFKKVGVTDGTKCGVSYVQAPVGGVPTIVLITTDCS